MSGGSPNSFDGSVDHNEDSDKLKLKTTGGSSPLSHDLLKKDNAEELPSKKTDGHGIKEGSFKNKTNYVAQVSSIDNIRYLIDRRGDCIGIKRMRVLGLTGFPEKIPTHLYIWFTHFLELSKLIDDVIKSEVFHPDTTKWVKFVNCQWERDMYIRQPVHHDLTSKDCSHCRRYVNELEHKAIWWFSIGNQKFIRLTFTNFYNDDITFECCILWIKIVGTLEVELTLQDAAEGESIRRHYRVAAGSSTMDQVTKDEKSESEICKGMSLSHAHRSQTSKGHKNSTQSAQQSTATEDNHKLIVLSDRGSRLLVTTKYLLKFLVNDRPLLIDTTYTFIRQPVSVFGVHNVGGFNPVGLAITINEDVADYDFIFRSIKNNITDFNYIPKVLICIATPAIQIATENVFGNATLICTCFAFVKRSAYNQLTKDSSINKNDRMEILAELDTLQLAGSDQSFNDAIQKFLYKWKKYGGFVDFFKEKWVIQNPNWRKGIFQGISNDNALESLCRSMKGLDSVHMLQEKVKDWSQAYQNFINF